MVAVFLTVRDRVGCHAPPTSAALRSGGPMSTDNEPQTAENRVEETVRTDWEGYDHPGTAVVERVSDMTDRDVTDLPLLQSTVDVDALEALLSFDGRTGAPRDGRPETVQITFRYAGLWVTVRSDRSMLLRVPAGSTA